MFNFGSGMDIDKDKRNFPRRAVELTACLNIGNKRMAGKVLDLTVGGVLLELACRLDVGGRMIITIDGGPQVKKNELRAEVIRCNPVDADPSRYIATAKFIEPNDEYLMDALALVHGKNPASE